MADFTNSKAGYGGLVPPDVVDTAWDAAEPLITPEKVRRLHLFGIPIVSAIKNPFTGKPDVIDDDLLKEHVIQAVALVELEAGFSVFHRQHRERHPWDKNLMDSWGHFVLRQRPVTSVEQVAITSTDGHNVYQIPKEWIDTGHLQSGQINIVPMAVSTPIGTPLGLTTHGFGLLPHAFSFPWVPGMWDIKFTTGWRDGMVPRTVNQLIGVVAAMEILSMLATTYSRSQSSSLGIDGLSQSTSGMGPELFKPRLEDLSQKRKWLISKLKRSVGLGLFVDNV